MPHIIPLRCESCGNIIEKKPKAKTPKYCTSCRKKKQELWREKKKFNRQRIMR